MEITFISGSLAKLVNSREELGKKYGEAGAKLVMMRMMFLKAAPSLADVPSSKPTVRHKLKGKRKAQFGVRVDNKWRIVFVPNHDPWPMMDDGTTLDFKKVTKITIIEVGDYHDG